MKTIIEFLTTIHRYRYTIWIMAIQEIKGKYAGSVLGSLWSIINPIVMVFIYWVVFSVGFKVPPPNNVPFLSWFFCAFIAWQSFCDALLSGSSSLQRNQTLIKKTQFPSEILPLISIVSSLINAVILICLLLLVLLIQGVTPSIWSFQVIYYLAAISVLALGGGWFFSAASIVLRDMGQVLAVVLQLLFWSTPIFYRLEMFPKDIHIFWKLNPVYYLTEGFRNSFLFGKPFWESPRLTLYFWIIALTLFVFGGWFFRKMKSEMVDNL
jgi:ABC-type polysaccharide/polyol phosphate export permease